MKLLEVCAGSLWSVENAQLGGAHRIELCTQLGIGGITPSAGMIMMARELFSGPINVLIRPRGGSFNYTSLEVETMKRDIELCHNLGVQGVVIGALTARHDIDVTACRELMDAAQGLDVTFHRAFDRCRDPQQALEQIIDLGCSRLLTSGQQDSALQGIELIAQLVKQAAGRISIMPGAGVNENNAADIIARSGAHEIHGSLRSRMPQGNKETDPHKVKTLIERINAI